jgi:hypothetical protein
MLGDCLKIVKPRGTQGTRGAQGHSKLAVKEDFNTIAHNKLHPMGESGGIRRNNSGGKEEKQLKTMNGNFRIISNAG